MLLRRRDRLFERFRQTGDARALAGVFDLTAPELLRVATHLVGDRATAEDLVQSTFVQVIRCAFQHAYDAERIDRPVRLGPPCKRTSTKVLRLHRAKQG